MLIIADTVIQQTPQLITVRTPLYKVQSLEANFGLGLGLDLGLGLEALWLWS